MNNPEFFKLLNNITYNYKLKKYEDIYKTIFDITNQIEQLKKAEPAPEPPKPPAPTSAEPVVKMSDTADAPSFSDRDEKSEADMASIPDEGGAREISGKMLDSYGKQSAAAKLLAPWLSGKFGRNLEISPEAIRSRMGITEIPSTDGSPPQRILHGFFRKYTVNRKTFLEHYDSLFKDDVWTAIAAPLKSWYKAYEAGPKAIGKDLNTIPGFYSRNIESGTTPEQLAFEKQRKLLTLHPFQDALSGHDMPEYSDSRMHISDHISSNKGFQWKHFSRTHPLTGFFQHISGLSSSGHYDALVDHLQKLISLDYDQTKPETIQSDIKRSILDCFSKKPAFTTNGFLASDAANGFPKITINKTYKNATISWTNPFSKVRVEAPISRELLESFFKEPSDVYNAAKWSQLLGVPSGATSPLVELKGKLVPDDAYDVFRKRGVSEAGQYFSNLDAILDSRLMGETSSKSVFTKPSSVDLKTSIRELIARFNQRSSPPSEIMEEHGDLHDDVLRVVHTHLIAKLHDDVHKDVHNLFKLRTETDSRDTLPAIHENFIDLLRDRSLFDSSLFDKRHKNDQNMGSDEQLQKTHKELLLYKIASKKANLLKPVTPFTPVEPTGKDSTESKNFREKILKAQSIDDYDERIKALLKEIFPSISPSSDWNPFIHPNSFILKSNSEPYLEKLGIPAQPFMRSGKSVGTANVRLDSVKAGDLKKSFDKIVKLRMRSEYPNLLKNPLEELNAIGMQYDHPNLFQAINHANQTNDPIGSTNNAGYKLGGNWRAGFTLDMIRRITEAIGYGGLLQPLNTRAVPNFMETSNPASGVTTQRRKQGERVPVYRPFSPEVTKGPFGAVYDAAEKRYKIFLIYRNNQTNRLEMPTRTGDIAQYHKEWDNATEEVAGNPDEHTLWTSHAGDAVEETNPDIMTAHNLYLKLRNRLFNAIINKNVTEINEIIPMMRDKDQIEQIGGLMSPTVGVQQPLTGFALPNIGLGTIQNPVTSVKPVTSVEPIDD